jgi:hypothetical protein
MEAKRSNWTAIAPGLLLTGVVGVLALPGAVLAFSSGVSVQPETSSEPITGLDTRATSPELVPAMAVRSLAQGHTFRFTPAGTTTRPDRSVTVAVRVDAQTARAISIREPLTVVARTIEQPGIAAPLRIAPTAYNLGVSRGYKRFAQPLVAPTEVRKIDMPDLTAFKPGSGTSTGPSRLTPRIELDEREVAGSAPRTFAGDSAETVEVGGSYRVTGNLDVTAGVRYSQERSRLQPLTDGKQDSQAVYVGTQFRF